MTKGMEELLFDTIEGAINYGQDPYGDFIFSKLYEAIEKLEGEVNETSDNGTTRFNESRMEG